MEASINKTWPTSLVSAIILVGGKYDRDLFKKCKKSLSWVDEIVEVKTKNIKGGFSQWRNEGLKKAKGNWILYVDTDEIVGKNLKNEILEVIGHKKLNVGCFAIPRKNIIFGKEFKHGGRKPDYQKRLFLKKNLKKWTGKLHEEPEFFGELKHLKNPLIHYKNSSISDMVEKTNKWSEIEAELMFKANHPKMNIFRFFSAGTREFVLRFIKQLSFLDGVKGVIYGMYQIFSKLISYSKLWEKQLSKTLT